MPNNDRLDVCPKCGSETHIVWGCMWDNDIEMCGSKNCRLEQYLPQSTMEDGEVIEMKDEEWE